jgi:hypothetical protein
MAYGSAKGRIFRGDIYAEDDTNKDTFIDWGNDYISFAVGGAKVLNVSSSGAIVQVLGTVSASSNVTASGIISASAYYGNGANLVGISAGTPGGSDTQVQYNNGGAFAGSATLTFDGTDLSATGRTSLLGGASLSSSTAQTWILPSTASQAWLIFQGAGKDYMVFDTQGRNVVVGSNYATTNIGGKLIASGTSAMQAVTATTISASSTLQVAGAVSHGSTLGVQGVSTFSGDVTINSSKTLGVNKISSSSGLTWTLPSTASQAVLWFAGSGKDYMVFDTQGRNVVVGSNYTTTNIGGRLVASGTATMQAVTATTISASSTLQVAGAATFATTVTGSRMKITERLGVNADSLVSLDVHYTGSGDPINLSNDTGGGEVVYFGGQGGAAVAGAIYYLNSSGDWASVDSATTGSGHNQLLGIALGPKASEDGMLIRGYFDVHTHYSGSFIKGGPVYIQSSSAASKSTTAGGYLSGAAPTNADSYVRVVGYGTDTANVIYFNPDSTYVELA